MITLILQRMICMLVTIYTFTTLVLPKFSQAHGSSSDYANAVDTMYSLTTTVNLSNAKNNITLYYCPVSSIPLELSELPQLCYNASELVV